MIKFQDLVGFGLDFNLVLVKAFCLYSWIC